MLRSSIYTASVLALTATGAFAQKTEVRKFHRIEGPVKDAGVLHVATGTWTRHNGNANLGGGASSIIYNCTSNSGYYGGIDPGQTWTESGRVPSLNSPGVLWNPTAAPIGSAPGSAAGCANSYTVDGYQIAYCSDAPGATTAITINFYQSWTAPVCFTPTAGAATHTDVLTALPGDPTPGGNACWIVTFDLSAGSTSFAMLADGDGTYVDNTSDAFAWSFTFPSVTSSTAATGIILAGAPADSTGPTNPGVGWKEFPPAVTTQAAGYDGTRFDGPAGAAAPTYPANGVVGLPNPGGEDGSDPVGDDGFRIEGGTLTPGCYFFGGPGVGPYSNAHMELYAKVTCAPPEPGNGYCFGDGLDVNVTTACPCGNFGAAGRGCASSFNSNGAKITGTGLVATDATQPVGSGVVLHGDGMNVSTGQICIFLQGDTNDPAGTIFGDGVRCAVGTLIRLRTEPIGPTGAFPGQATGTSQFPEPGDPVPLSTRGMTPPGSGLTRYYTVYYRNAAAGFCPPATFNTSNGYQITW